MTGALSGIRVKDGYFCIAADQQHYWKRFCEVAGLDALIEDPRFATNRERVEHLAELQEAMECALRGHGMCPGPQNFS